MTEFTEKCMIKIIDTEMCVILTLYHLANTTWKESKDNQYISDNVLKLV